MRRDRNKRRGRAIKNKETKPLGSHFKNFFIAKDMGGFRQASRVDA
jgi:hypothetical protein